MHGHVSSFIQCWTFSKHDLAAFCCISLISLWNLCNPLKRLTDWSRVHAGLAKASPFLRHRSVANVICMIMKSSLKNFFARNIVYPSPNGLTTSNLPPTALKEQLHFAELSAHYFWVDCVLSFISDLISEYNFVVSRLCEGMLECLILTLFKFNRALLS